MNNFLQQDYFNNTVQDYLITAGVILIAFLFKRYIAHYIASLIFLLLRQRYKTIDKGTFTRLVARPLGLFIAVLLMVIVLDRLTFPPQFDVKIYHVKLRDILRTIGTALIIITFFRFLIKCIDFLVLMIKERYLQKGDAGNHQLVFFFKDFIKVVVGIIGLLMLMKYAFHYDVKGLLTGLSIVGAAVALALKESLENLIASFIIFFDKPFETGDAVKVNAFSGVVERIGLRSTRIRTDAKTYITVPNKQMVDSVLDNLSNRTQRRSELRIEIAPATPPQKVDELLNGIKNILRKKEIENFSLYLSEITADSLIVTGDYYTEPHNLANHNTIKQMVNFEVLQLIDALQIDMAGKVTDVKIVRPTT